MVDIASPNVTSRQNGSPIDIHDAETFRVAEELMLLSASKARRPSGKDGAYDTSVSYETQRKHPAHFDDRTSFARSKRQKALGAQFDTLQSPTTVVNHPFARDNIATAGEVIINSRSDVSHSQLLSEHRSRFRRTRRRWNIESANKQKAYLARFHVQGIPLVEHLASLRAPKERKPSNSAAVRTRHCAEPATTAVEIIATSTFGRSAGSALGPSAADFSGATPSHDPSDWQNWWEEYLNENDATDKDDGMGNYDREVPWRVMQPRHAMTNSGLCNPSYFNGSAFTGIHDANITGDRRSGVSGVYGGADTNSSTYYTDDRPGSAKRQRLASVTRPAELTTMKAPTPDGDVGTQGRTP
ncbi:hypothetical protein Poli38472_009285 [Pythium oligandrum]|uniref:Uncharacterized protein n=1 Tax=Pythium oligandrum TaxID=41045 RepID=A0A8K1CLF9_PYTOL|nr:hypothetical protein Poli38472_009285 [Pythium oligandrum]|eukprot:TMW65118.1 hypothetical protein Poli38472_009285 [Pythium oligandrum]